MPATAVDFAAVFFPLVTLVEILAVVDAVNGTLAILSELRKRGGRHVLQLVRTSSRAWHRAAAFACALASITAPFAPPQLRYQFTGGPLLEILISHRILRYW